MVFRAPVSVAETNAKYLSYLTDNLSDREAGKLAFIDLLSDLGNTVESLPRWHPILTAPKTNEFDFDITFKELDVYCDTDHTVFFVRGFVTCPYSESSAEELVNAVNGIPGLDAYRLQTPLYSDAAFPVAVIASEVVLDDDGTIRSRDALAWCTQILVKNARSAQVAEDWWNLQSYLLGSPHGSRSSLVVNQHTGGHMRKIVEVLNASGMFGPVKEWSLQMLSEKKRKTICETLIRAAVNNRIDGNNRFEFQLRGESCVANISDVWKDGSELSIKVTIGNTDLVVTGLYYPARNLVQSTEPNGKRALAELFL